MVLVSTSCFDEVILADSDFGISSYDKTWSDFLLYFNRIDFFVFTYFMVWFRENPKLVEASFFLMSSWMAVK